MFTSIDKALIALVMSVAFMLNQFGLDIPAWFTESGVTGVISALNPILVYFFANKVAA